MNERIRAYRDTLLLTLIALPLGLAIGAMDALFGRVLLSVTAFRMAHVYSLLPFLGLVGVGIVWCYQKVGGTSGKGMALLFEAGHGDTQDIPLRLIPLVMVSTWLTHLFGGSAGREGVAVQIGGTLAHSIGKRLPIPDAGKQLLLTGMAAGFAGLFRTPIAATFFALEVLTAGVLEYSALLPALVASFSASACSGLLGLEKFTVPLTDQVAFSAPLVGKLLLFGLVFGMAGGLFAFALHKLKALFAQYLPNPLLRIFLFGVLVSGFSLLCWEGRYSGLGTNLIAMSFDSGIFSWDFALKWIFTVVTLAAGFQGGEVTPLFSIGASLGVLLGTLCGLPTAFVAALGYAAVFGSASNTLLAPMLIGGEVFGFAYLPYFFVVCAVAYLCNGGSCIYPLQKGR
mgnify:CR=1 FL=1